VVKYNNTYTNISRSLRPYDSVNDKAGRFKVFIRELPDMIGNAQIRLRKHPSLTDSKIIPLNENIINTGGPSHNILLIVITAETIQQYLLLQELLLHLI
jgi:hypothetical protein